VYESFTMPAVWNAIEYVPWPKVQEIQVAKFRRQMRYTLDHSLLYQDKYRDIGLSPEDIRTLEDISRLPFTEKDELRESLVAAGDLGNHAAAPLRDVVQRQATSGTSGRPSYVGLTEHDVQVCSEMQARCFVAAGMMPGDVMLHAFGMSRGFGGGLPMVQAAQYMGIGVLPIGAEAGPERLLQVARDQHATSVIGTPHFLLHVGRQAEQVLGVPASELSVRTVFAGGEPGASIPSVRAQIESVWGAKCIEMYGGTDLGAGYWAECLNQDGMHFTGHEFLLPEIIDPATGQVIEVKDGVEGELVYSTIDRDSTPLLRFRSHDLVHIIGAECGCGRTAFRLKVLGRSDDMFIVRGINVFPSAVRDVINAMAPATGEFRIVAAFDGNATNLPLLVRVERGSGTSPTDSARIAASVEQELRRRLAAAFTVEIVAPETFERPGVAKVNVVVRERA
jgi:phenylacetate-CoA ligase